ncbi:MAG: hypothetical protein R3E79_46690 [Caldilineaceae bacterium]
MATTDAGTLWLYKEIIGFDTIPDELTVNTYAKVMLCCANGDGRLTPAERAWVIGFVSAFNASLALPEELAAYTADEDVYALATSRPAIRYNLRSVLYDTIQACSADGDYHAEERALIRRLAARFDIADHVVTQLEEVYTETRRIRKKRLELTFVQGAPY